MIIGCGRVGSAVAKQLAADGWNVTCVDEDENALARLGAWKGGFVVGHGMDADILEEAGATDAEAAVVSTDGDNSNIVIGQILQRRYGIGCVVVRVLDPARAEFYAKLGQSHDICLCYEANAPQLGEVIDADSRCRTATVQ